MKSSNIKISDHWIESLDMRFTVMLGPDSISCYIACHEEFLDLERIEGDPEFRVASTIQCISRRASKKDNDYHVNTVLVLPKSSRGQLHRTIAHEAVHCAWFMLNYSEIKVSANNHEILARLVEYIFQTTINEIGKGKTKTRGGNAKCGQ